MFWGHSIVNLSVPGAPGNCTPAYAPDPWAISMLAFVVHIVWGGQAEDREGHF